VINPRIRKAIRPLIVAFFLLALGASVAQAVRNKNLTSPIFRPDARDHLGSEHDQIAQALYRGRGFSDPFSRETGPTAWMAPVFPVLLAAIYTATDGNPHHVVSVYYVLQLICVTIAILPALLIAERLRIFWFGTLICAIALTALFFPLFQLTHDHALQISMVVLIWWHFSRTHDSDVRWRWGLWTGVIAGMSALLSPVLGAVCAILAMYRSRRRPEILAIVAVLSITIIAPWTMRNWIEMGRLIPIKSNLDYEFWQANIADSDGVVDSETFRTHPALRPYGSEAENYVRLGEYEFLKLKRGIWWNRLRADPNRFVNNTANRFVAALLWYQPTSLYEHPKVVAINRCWKLLPIISLMLILFDYTQPIPNWVYTAVSLWLLVLLPYSIVSYYDRYSWPTMPMQVIIVVYAAHRLATRIRTRFSCSKEGVKLAPDALEP